MQKLTIYAEPDNFILAVRAAKSLAQHPDSKDMIVSFEDGSYFYVKRNKAGVTVKQEPKP